MERWHTKTSLKRRRRATCLNWLRAGSCSAHHMDNLIHSELRWPFCECERLHVENKALSTWQSSLSICLQVNGVPVEAIHPLLFARQRWVVLMVEVVAACSVCQYSNPPPVPFVRTMKWLSVCDIHRRDVLQSKWPHFVGDSCFMASTGHFHAKDSYLCGSQWCARRAAGCWGEGLCGGRQWWHRAHRHSLQCWGMPQKGLSNWWCRLSKFVERGHLKWTLTVCAELCFGWAGGVVRLWALRGAGLHRRWQRYHQTPHSQKPALAATAAPTSLWKQWVRLLVSLKILTSPLFQKHE